jgi:hypothetical protein
VIASAPPPSLALTASPAHVALSRSGRQVVHLAAAGRGVHVTVSVRGYALDLRGRPRILAAPSAAAPWLRVSRRSLAVGRAGAALTVRAAPPRGARPGDHVVLVLLTAAVPSSRGVLLRMRIGIPVSIRVPGAVAKPLALRGLRVRRVGRARVLELMCANVSSVVRSIRAHDLTVALLVHGRVVARLHPAPRELFPHARGIVELHYGGARRGRVVARIDAPKPGGGLQTLRRFPLRL